MAAAEAQPDTLDLKRLFTFTPTKRETAILSYQHLADTLKAKQVRKQGLDTIREHYVFDTFNEVIEQIHHNDMLERSVLLKRAEKQLSGVISTWKILCNQSSLYALKKSNADRAEIERLQQDIEQLHERKRQLMKQRHAMNKQYDETANAARNEMTGIVSKNLKEAQRHQQHIESNTQILQEYKSASSLS
mmetsp:Transcript_8262/g.13505  ORF Transcript_8262/g.13505 Transcript_8262/m.13505 type:complete len:190 (-) Transcript_8262:100-669(-)